MLGCRFVAVVWFLAYADAQGTAVLNNGGMMFQTGCATSSRSGPSVDQMGNLAQPCYYADSNTLRKLTYNSNGFDGIVAFGTSSGSSLSSTAWNTQGTPYDLAEVSPSSITIDESGVITAGGKTYGDIVVTSTFVGSSQQIVLPYRRRRNNPSAVGPVYPVPAGVTLSLVRTYSLPETAGTPFTYKIATTVTGGPLLNIRIWLGTKDDWVGMSDKPTKQIGYFNTGNEFVRVAASTNVQGSDPKPGQVLKISTTDEGVFFAPGSPVVDGTLAVQAGYGDFNNVYAKDPSASSTSYTNDGSYGMYIPVGDLSDGQTKVVSVFYGAGKLADLTDISAAVAVAAQTDSPTTAQPSSQPSAGSANCTYTLTMSRSDSSQSFERIISGQAADETFVVQGCSTVGNTCRESYGISAGARTIRNSAGTVVGLGVCCNSIQNSILSVTSECQHTTSAPETATPETAVNSHRIFKCFVFDGAPKLFKYFGCDGVNSSSKVLTSDITGSAKWCHLEAKSSEQMLCKTDNDSSGRSYLHHCDEHSSTLFSSHTWENSGTVAWTSGFNNNGCHGQPANTRPWVTFEQEGNNSYDSGQSGECINLEHTFKGKGCCINGSSHNSECAGVKGEFVNRGCCHHSSAPTDQE